MKKLYLIFIVALLCIGAPNQSWAEGTAIFDSKNVLKQIKVMQNKITEVKDAVDQYIQTGQKAITEGVGVIQKNVAYVQNTVKDTVGDAVQTTVKAGADAVRPATESVGKVVNTAKNGIQTGVNKAKDMAGAGFAYVSDKAKDLFVDTNDRNTSTQSVTTAKTDGRDITKESTATTYANSGKVMNGVMEHTAQQEKKQEAAAQAVTVADDQRVKAAATRDEAWAMAMDVKQRAQDGQVNAVSAYPELNAGDKALMKKLSRDNIS